jgi:tRNA nucleotidyltransferase (CCA-adding enzyme)
LVALALVAINYADDEIDDVDHHYCLQGVPRVRRPFSDVGEVVPDPADVSAAAAAAVADDGLCLLVCLTMIIQHLPSPPPRRRRRRPTHHHYYLHQYHLRRHAAIIKHWV